MQHALKSKHINVCLFSVCALISSSVHAPLTLTGGSAPWTPTGALPLDPRYTLVLHTRHGSHTLCSCKVTLKIVL